MAAASAAQAVLYLSGYGTSERTDGFFIAFALYTTIGVFSQSLRLTAAPLLVEPGASLRPRELARALVIMALPVLLATGPLAGPLAALLAPGFRPRLARSPSRRCRSSAGPWRSSCWQPVARPSWRSALAST